MSKFWNAWDTFTVLYVHPHLIISEMGEYSPFRDLEASVQTTYPNTLYLIIFRTMTLIQSFC